MVYFCSCSTYSFETDKPALHRGEALTRFLNRLASNDLTGIQGRSNFERTIIKYMRGKRFRFHAGEWNVTYYDRDEMKDIEAFFRSSVFPRYDSVVLYHNGFIRAFPELFLIGYPITKRVHEDEGNYDALSIDTLLAESHHYNYMTSFDDESFYFHECLLDEANTASREKYIESLIKTTTATGRFDWLDDIATEMGTTFVHQVLDQIKDRGIPAGVEIHYSSKYWRSPRFDLVQYVKNQYPDRVVSIKRH